MSNNEVLPEYIHKAKAAFLDILLNAGNLDYTAYFLATPNGWDENDAKITKFNGMEISTPVRILTSPIEQICSKISFAIMLEINKIREFMPTCRVIINYENGNFSASITK